ncbi:hypothetical protein G6F37_004712 [Rhizopus arrhizus]|nr:hypothetical protein G6F38_004403 [Rhizopus arrhizus]KAG1159625.1 hypothetical protein G6F37_004712 [Rhizopus arrhizus]
MNIGERGTSTTMMSVSGNEDDETLTTLSSATTTSIVPYISNELTASIIPSSTPNSPSISSPLSVPTQFAEINISPPTTDDRMIFNDIDIHLFPEIKVAFSLLSDRIGCGEVKAQYQALSHRLVGIDLVRVATLAKDASDKHKLKSIFAFLVVGKNATFYIINRAKTDLYTMCEIAHIQLPFSLDQVPLFISQLNKVIKVITCFQSVVNGDNHDYAQNPVTLTDHIMHQVTDAKISNKRKAIFSHYSH